MRIKQLWEDIKDPRSDEDIQLEEIMSRAIDQEIDITPVIYVLDSFEEFDLEDGDEDGEVTSQRFGVFETCNLGCIHRVGEIDC